MVHKLPKRTQITQAAIGMLKNIFLLHAKM